MAEMKQTMSNQARCCVAATENSRNFRELTPIRFKRLSAAVCLAISALSMWACASPMAPAASNPTFTVSGTVFERTPSGTAPVEGVFVAETNSHRNATTDAKGFYRIEGFSSGSISLWASKSYYYVSKVTLAISGDVSTDIEIVEVTE
jgi:hypothetical protein